MTRPSNYYDMLRVAPTASATDIRAAYLRLMKQYHPDLAGGRKQTEGAASRVATINLCYDTLKIPSKRAAYDESIARQINLALEPRAEREGRTPRGSGKFSAAVLVILLSAGLGLFAYSGTLLWANSFSEEHRAMEGLDISTRDSGPLLIEGARNQARLAREMSYPEAMSFSARCFESARHTQEVMAAELCVIFDEAFVYWHENPSSGRMLPFHFADDVRRTRHLKALGSWGHTPERALHLQQIAFVALLQDLKASSFADSAAVAPQPMP